MTLRLGAHESIAGGIYKAFDRAESVGCDAVQVFVKPNRSWAIPPLAEEDITRFKLRGTETGIRPVVAHTSYLLNLASPEAGLWSRSIKTLVAEMERCEKLDIPFLVLHPGHHVGTGTETGLERVARGLGAAHAATTDFRVRILLENTAGQGTALGANFKQLTWLLANTPQGGRLGICLDTCHLFAAGYELRTVEGYSKTMSAFDTLVGLERLHAFHLNDCKHDLGSGKDRHEHIGEGFIGLDGFRNILNDPRLDGLPGLLETPKSDDLQEDRENLARLRSLVELDADGHR